MTAAEAQSPLDAARKLAPQIRACADAIEAARELPRPLFEALADAGLFHLAVPRAIGGGEIDLPSYVEVIEEIGKADASTGWAVNQGAIYATYAARMPRDVARAIWMDVPRSAPCCPPPRLRWSRVRSARSRARWPSPQGTPPSRWGWPAAAWTRSSSWPAPRRRAPCRRCCGISR